MEYNKELSKNKNNSKNTPNSKLLNAKIKEAIKSAIDQLGQINKTIDSIISFSQVISFEQLINEIQLVVDFIIVFKHIHKNFPILELEKVESNFLQTMRSILECNEKSDPIKLNDILEYNLKNDINDLSSFFVKMLKENN